MNTLQRKTRFLSSAFAIILLGSHPIALAAKKDQPSIQKPKFKLTPSLRKNAKASRKNFQGCKKEALAQLKQGSIKKQEFKEALNLCQDRFAGGALFVKCKKEALKSRPKGLKKTMKRCRGLLQAATFSPKDLTPYLMHNQQLYFAGLGFSNAQDVQNLDLPNFNCESLKTHMKSPQETENFLFGNSPKSFQNFKVKRWRKLIAKKTFPPSLNKESFVKHVGFFQPKTESTPNLLYFPVSQCSAEGDLGEKVKGLSAYYILDTQSEQLIPFMAATFYDANKTPSKKRMVRNMKTILGSDYNISNPFPGFQYLSTHPINDFDPNGDPINLCKSLNKNNYLGIIKLSTEHPQRVEYTVIANLKALCHFGNKVFHRL